MDDSRRIRAATPDDLDAATHLLGRSGLPLEGLEYTRLWLLELWLLELWLLETDGTLAGVGGFERYGDLALLRSLAVTPEGRGRGLGGALLHHLLKTLQADGVVTVYGLTTTVPEWLLRLGFREITRDELPVSLSSSEQLRGACPASAKGFAKDLL